MYLVVNDAYEDYCDFYITEELNEDLINSCLNDGDIQIIDSINLTFLVDSNNGILVWQKIPKK